MSNPRNTHRLGCFRIRQRVKFGIKVTYGEALGGPRISFSGGCLNATSLQPEASFSKEKPVFHRWRALPCKQEWRFATKQEVAFGKESTCWFHTAHSTTDLEIHGPSSTKECSFRKITSKRKHFCPIKDPPWKADNDNVCLFHCVNHFTQEDKIWIDSRVELFKWQTRKEIPEFKF